uniref:AAA+ ATPase domain-containing protein n=1 Tax=Spongospora subterranea TaxID=70186 RepID=A0A0H5R9K5_9EUKA|eukprot:CRZ10800.1 hypothetical protein [Spongospora subterranea]
MGKGDRRGRLERELYDRVAEWVGIQDTLPSTEMAVAYVCERFPSYSRLKRVPFSKTVAEVLKSISDDNVESIVEGGETGSEPAELVDYQDSNTLNASMRSFYSKEPPAKKLKSAACSPTAAYEDIGGMDETLQEIREIIEPVLIHPEIYDHLGVHPPTGILLHGPPGCGKTLLARAVAGELDVAFISISAPEIVSGMSGESEAKVRQLFAEAQRRAPCLVFVDEVDCITPKRENAGKEMERRIVAQLLTCMETLSSSKAPVVVIGATNRPDSLDPALRRAGRFDREICIGIPKETSRESILRVLTRRMRLEGEIDIKLLARKTAGYVGADLASLCKEAAVIAVSRAFSGSSSATLSERSEISNGLRGQTERFSPEQLEPLYISEGDFSRALQVVQPSSKREGFATTPDVSWSDIGALESLANELRFCIVMPIVRPALFASFSLSIPAGVLLFGPPGCGKTLVAKAVANESGANFISIKGPELLNKFVGESERAVRQVFQRARASAPCVIFFDELDALCPRRGGFRQGDAVSERVVNTLLTEMDGMDSRRHVYVIAATNRPDMIDSAMLRPGRLDKLLYVPLPNQHDRAAILRSHTRKIPLSDDVDIEKIVADSRCSGYSGADIAALAREASLSALKRHLSEKEGDVVNMTDSYDDQTNCQVTPSDFMFALQKVFPSVSEATQRKYDRMHYDLKKSRTNVDSSTNEVAVDVIEPEQSP